MIFMSEPAESGAMPNSWSRETGSLLSLPQSADVKWGRLVLVAFALNLAIAMVGWLLVGLLN
jgi:hypothetical protein